MRGRIHIAWLLAGPIAAAAAAPGPPLDAEPPPPGAAGAALFARHCAGCHGSGGGGDGPASRLLSPAPRDLAKEPLRFAAIGGAGPAVGVERAIARGVPASAMPAFGGVLSDGEIRALAEHVLSLRPDVPAPKAPAPAPAPVFTPELIARGERLFDAAACSGCHGDHGRGDGPGAAGLMDSAGRAVSPADLTRARLRSGPGDEDIYRTISIGAPGTPMIGYRPVLVRRRADRSVDDTDIWALVAYIRSLGSGESDMAAGSGATIRVAALRTGAAAEDPGHEDWLAVEPVLIELRPVSGPSGGADSLEVRAARDADRLVVRLRWQDSSMSGPAEMHPDRAAVMISRDPEPPPLPIGGAPAGSTEPSAVAAARWAAAPMEAPSAAPPAGRSARRAARVCAPAAESAARDSATSAASWQDGHWHVALALPMSAVQGTEGGAAGVLPIAFATWDGASGEGGVQKRFSSWHWLVIGGDPAGEP